MNDPTTEHVTTCLDCRRLTWRDHYGCTECDPEDDEPDEDWPLAAVHREQVGE